MARVKIDFSKPYYPLPDGKTPPPLTYCKICEQLPKTARMQIYKDLIDALSPTEIFRRVMAAGHKMTDYRNDHLTNTDDFHCFLYRHLYHCLRENPDIYHEVWREKEQQRKMEASLKARQQEILSEQPETSNAQLELRNRYNKKLNNVPKNEPAKLTTKEQLDEISVTLPRIIANHLRILEREQSKYLSGEINEPPINDIKTIESLMRSLTTMMGSKASVREVFETNRETN
jgi:hypothetical protein